MERHYDGTARGKLSSRTRVSARNKSVRVLIFLVPCHLNGFELAFVRLLRIVFELRQFGYEPMQVGEANGERIGVGMLLRQRDSDVFGVIPSQVFRHGFLKKNSKLSNQPIKGLQ